MNLLHACPSGKVSYPTERDARTHAKYLHHKIGKRFDPYDCSHCSHWHLTTRRKPSHRRRRRRST